MRAHQQIPGLLAALIAMSAAAQTPYPELTIQDVAWSEGTHHYAVSNSILSPGTPNLPATISGTADAEFVSATSVHLAPGFHAGALSGNGRFRARIDQALGQVADLIIIPQEPYSYIADNIVHVHKWEKLEVGLRLPQDYQEAIERFFEHYYAHSSDPDIATPGNVSPAHDLNPFADDSLQLLITLVDPTSSVRYKWGFYMKEAKWTSTSALSGLSEDFADPLHPYHVRFRVAPDTEGMWQFTITLNAPHTTTSANVPLTAALSTGFNFYCDPPLAENKGPLSVNPVNRQMLKTSTGEPFFALGTNLNPTPVGTGWNNPASYQMRRGSFENMVQSLQMLAGSGGNFFRTWLYNKSFAAEHVNLGVYDRYRDGLSCNNVPIVRGNGQYQAWAFDQIMDLARELGIYTQLTVVAYPPITNYESWGWHNDPYLNSFVMPRDPSTNLLDLKRYFYLDGNPANKTTGPMYYWKRYYKYLMARWGYSVNLAIIEPFQEIDQMLTYSTVDLTNAQDNANCQENKILWPEDPALPGVLDEWLTDIAQYVRGDNEIGSPESSALEEKDKLFLISYAGGPGWSHSNQALVDNYYRPFANPEVDLLDAHLGFHPDYTLDGGEPDGFMNATFLNVEGFRSRFPSLNSPSSARKPFNQGEHNHYSKSWAGDLEGFFHNYDVSFHNELWTSAFTGKFAAGTSWIWKRVYWLPNPPTPPNDNFNEFQQNNFSNTIPGQNLLDIGFDEPVIVPNRRLHHHFKPLADLLNLPSIRDIGFFDDDFAAYKFFDDNNQNLLQSFYLKNSANNTAIGWVHNRYASVMNNFYLTSTEQNFLGCIPPNAQSQILTLPGFDDTQEYYVTWFPTRWNMSDLPPDSEDPLPDADNDPSTITLDLTGRFGGTVANYLDTLRSDYAFLITPLPFVKSLRLPIDNEANDTESDWDFGLFPNPTRGMLHLRLPSDGVKSVRILDVAGRTTYQRIGISGSNLICSLDELAKGLYLVHVGDGVNTKTKKLILH